MDNQTYNQGYQNPQMQTKYCRFCGAVIPAEAVVCPACGRQVEEMKNKWVALLLCFFFGGLGVHKFYEGKVGMGILYLFTVGLFGIGTLVDFIMLLLKPNPYYV